MPACWQLLHMPACLPTAQPLPQAPPFPHPQQTAELGEAPRKLRWLASAADGDAVNSEQFMSAMRFTLGACAAAGASDAALVAALQDACSAATSGDGMATEARGDVEAEAGGDTPAEAGGDMPSDAGNDVAAEAGAAAAHVNGAGAAEPAATGDDSCSGEAMGATEASGMAEAAPSAMPQQAEADPDPDAGPVPLPVPAPYVHPSGCRAYLSGGVVPLLRQGMYEMVAQLERDRIKLCKGDEWTDDGYLPPNWMPFSPFRCEHPRRRVHSFDGTKSGAAFSASLSLGSGV